MEKMGFPSTWIERMMSCVTTSSFSILVDGKAYGMIQPSRVICQGDPLPPYLFFFVCRGFHLPCWLKQNQNGGLKEYPFVEVHQKSLI